VSMRNLRHLPLALALLVLAAGVTACGGGDDASGEATLTVYSGRNEALVGPLLDRFSEQTGIELEVRYGDTAELAATLREEGDRSPADVFFAQDGGALGAIEKAGLLTRLPQGTLDEVDARYRSPSGQWVGASGRVRVIAYDKRALRASDLPDSVFDLVDERWKGTVGWAPTNGSFQAFVTAMRKVHGEAATEEWLTAMKDNDAQAYENNLLVRDAIAAGEIQVGLINHYYVMEALREEESPEDYPVALHFAKNGDVGALINVAGVGILASSEHQAQARRFVDFLLTRAAQEYFREETAEYPIAAGVRPLAALPALDSIEQPDVDLTDIDDLQGTLELLEKTGVL
jgi:iron(III) transport system substrate-binding protein